MYMAPEVLKGKYNELIDVWSIGVVMYIMLSGRPPFPGKDEQVILKHVRKAEITFEHKQWANVTQPTKDFLLKLLAKEPEIRPSASDALTSQWLKDMISTEEAHLSSLAVDNLKSFAQMGRLKKAALFVIATQLKDQQITELKQYFLAMDKDQDVTLSASEIQ